MTFVQTAMTANEPECLDYSQGRQKPAALIDLEDSIDRAEVVRTHERGLLASLLRRLVIVRDDPTHDAGFVQRIETLTAEISARMDLDSLRLDVAKIDLQEQVQRWELASV